MSSAVSTESLEKSPRQRSTGWSRKRKILVIGGTILAIIVVALAVGLGVGLTRHHDDDSGDDNGGDDNSGGDSSGGSPYTGPGNATLPPDPSTNVTDPTTNTTYWQPAVGMSWQLVLRYPLNSTLPNNTQVWDIDLFDNTHEIISGLRENQARVICYFSAGSYENWRPDASNFSSEDLGHNLDGWPGEKWLNVSSPRVRAIMSARLDLAVTKGCNGVDPDNVDGYDNKDNGLDLTQDQAVDYVQWLATEAHTRGLSVGLKNAGAIIPQVLSVMQWSVNEQCVQYQECDTYAAFVHADKPVFHVEYPKGDNTNNYNNVSASTLQNICDDPTASNFSTIIKNIQLDLWEQTC